MIPNSKNRISMNINRYLFLCLGIMAVCFSITASAELITSTAAMGNTVANDFSFFEYETTLSNSQVGEPFGMDVKLTSLLSVRSRNSPRSLGDQGEWNEGRNWFLAIDYTGIHPNLIYQQASVWFEFKDEPVSSIGALLNQCNPAPANAYYYHPGVIRLEAYNAEKDLLEWYIFEIPSNSGQNNSGVFRGIQRSKPEITHFAISGNCAVVDDLTITINEVDPEFIFADGYEE